MNSRVPSLNTLRAFEAAARLQGFTRAAEELSVTQAAVSQQVRQLEELVGQRLFRRDGRRLIPTTPALSYAAVVRDTLERLTTATAEHFPAQSSELLNVSVMFSFASRWLVGRLWRFHAGHDNWRVRVSTADDLVDFSVDGVDVGVRYGRGVWAGVHAELVAAEHLFPVCSPAYLAAANEPIDITRHALIYDFGARGEGWEQWFRFADLEDNPRYSVGFDNNALVLQAAVAGHGIALGRSMLVADDIAAGRLVQIDTRAMKSEFGYHLVCLKGRETDPIIRAFADWLHDEATASDEMA